MLTSLDLLFERIISGERRCANPDCYQTVEGVEVRTVIYAPHDPASMADNPAAVPQDPILRDYCQKCGKSGGGGGKPTRNSGTKTSGAAQESAMNWKHSQRNRR